MAGNLGADTQFGIGLESTWDTAVAVTQKAPVLSNGLDRPVTNNPSTILCGTPARGRARRSSFVPAGSLNFQWTYDLQQVWIEHLCGTFTNETTPTLDHFDVDDRVTSSLTLAEIKRSGVVHEYSGIMINTATLTGNVADGMRWALDCLYGSRAITGTTNNSAAIEALSALGDEILYEELTVRVGDLANALAGSDVVEPTDIEVVFNWNRKHDFVTSRTPLQPEQNGFRDVTVRLTFPRIETDQYITWMDAGTLVQMDMDWTDGTEQKVIRFPVGRVSAAPQTTDGPELQPMTIEFMFENNVNDANTQTGFTFEPEWQILEEGG